MVTRPCKSAPSTLILRVLSVYWIAKGVGMAKLHRLNQKDIN